MNERLKIDRKTYQFMEKRYHKHQTLDLMIQQKEWVPGGMDELMKMMIDSFSYFDVLVSFSCYQPLSCHQYSWALGYTLASMWVMAYNARIGAIERMTMSDYHAIDKEVFHLANQFKTSNSYSYQIVNTTDVVDLYVKYLRKYVIPDDIDSEEAALFPSWKGTPLSQGEASKKISNIFKRYGYNLSVTRLRAIISTHVEERYQSGNITMEEYERFIQTGQTHTMATHRKFYVKKRKYEEGQLLQDSYEKIFPTPPIINDYYENRITEEEVAYLMIENRDEYSPHLYSSDTFTTDLQTPHDSSYLPTPHLPSRCRGLIDEVREFGLARSDIDEIKKKYDWIKEEIDYLVEYIQIIAPELPSAAKNKYATCLTFLKQSAPAEVIQYFHPHHLVNSDRLKNGYLRAIQLINEGADDSI